MDFAEIHELARLYSREDITHVVSLKLLQLFGQMQGKYPLRKIRSILITPKGSKTSLYHLHTRMMDLDPNYLKIKVYCGIFEVSKRGVPHFHGFCVSDCRSKDFSNHNLVVKTKPISNIYHYMKYMVKDNPRLLVVNANYYYHSDQGWTEETLHSKTILDYLNNIEPHWT